MEEIVRILFLPLIGLRKSAPPRLVDITLFLQKEEERIVDRGKCLFGGLDITGRAKVCTKQERVHMLICELPFWDGFHRSLPLLTIPYSL
jgi:hypothetical protein